MEIEMTSINAGGAFYRVQNELTQNADRLSQNMQRLASGNQNISPGDRTGTSAIAYNMRAESASLKVGMMNGTEALQSLEMVTNDLALMNDIVVRLEEIHALGSNAYNTAQDTAALSAEATNLLAEMTRIAADATWKGNNIIKATQADTTTNTMDFGRNTASIDIVLDSFEIPEVALGFNTVGDDVYGKIDTTGSSHATGTAYATLTTPAINVASYSQTFANRPEGGATSDGTVTTDKVISALAIDGAVFHEHLTKANQTKTLTADDDAISKVNGATLTLGEALKLDGDFVTTTPNGVALLNDPAKIEIISDDLETTKSGVFTVVGTDINNNAITENISLTTANTAVSSINFYKTITSITKALGDGTALESTSVGDAIKVGIATAGLVGPKELAGSDIGSGSAEAALALGSLKTVVDNMNINAGTLFNKVSNVISHMGSLDAGYQMDVSSKTDVDFAGETAALAKGQILAQAGTAMLAQANAQQQGMLALLQS
jgi:flagellin